MIGRERRRLARAFRLAMAAATGPALVMACDAGGSGDGGEDASVRDATARDATAPADAAVPLNDAGGNPVTSDAAPIDAARDSADAARPVDATVPDAFAQSGCYAGGVDLDSSFGVDAPPGQDTCAYFYGCGVPQGLAVVGCALYDVTPDGALIPIYGETCWIPDDAGCENDALAPGDGGAITILCNPCFGGGGRRPAGLVAPAARGASPVGAWLAGLAFEEEASIAAFARMERELVERGAPCTLVTAVRRAATDEARHARIMGRLARRRGGDVAKVRVKRSRRRSTASMAVENAAEGCVRETFGALLAQWQATHAADANLRDVFGAIARDEARHAALSWAVARWLEPRLDARGRRRVAAARKRALRTLQRSFEEPHPGLARDAGLPSAARGRALLASMAQELGLTTVARR